MTNLHKGHGTRRRAVLIVERDFLRNHVGVRRVIIYYWRKLLDADFTVVLATPDQGELFVAARVSLSDVVGVEQGTEAQASAWNSVDRTFNDNPFSPNRLIYRSGKTRRYCLTTLIYRS